LYDAQGWRVVPVEAGGVISGNKTQGDRLRAQNPITVTSFDNYVSQLQAQKIILDVEERKASIVAQMRQIVEGDDCSIVTDQSLLDETARLVEWPVVLRGQINSEFSVLICDNRAIIPFNNLPHLSDNACFPLLNIENNFLSL
jgi:glycyl-tRNA synthetase beta chain